MTTDESYLFSLPGETDRSEKSFADMSPEEQEAKVQETARLFTETIVEGGLPDSLQGKPSAFVTSASLPGLVKGLMDGIVPKVMMPTACIYAGIALAQAYPELCKKLQEVVKDMSPIIETGDATARVIAAIYDKLLARGFSDGTDYEL